jgi:hypothetical protein
VDAACSGPRRSCAMLMELAAVLTCEFVWAPGLRSRIWEKKDA